MMENKVNGTSKTPVVEKKPFLKRGSRKEPSALHRINKSPSQLSSSSPSSSAMSSPNTQQGSGSGLSRNEWDASWTTSSAPSASRDPPSGVCSNSQLCPNPSNTLPDPSSFGKVRNSDEFVAVPKNLGKVRNSNEFVKVNQVEDKFLSGRETDMDMDRSNNSSDTSSDNMNVYRDCRSDGDDGKSYTHTGYQTSQMRASQSQNGMDELEEFAELERALEEIDSPEPSFHRDYDHAGHNSYSNRPQSGDNFMKVSNSRDEGNVESSILKSSSQSLPLDTKMSDMFGSDTRREEEEASSTEYTPVQGFDQYISGDAVRKKNVSAKEESMYQVSEYDLHKTYRPSNDYISSDDEGLSPNDSGVSQAQFVLTEEMPTDKHLPRQHSPSSWGPAVSYPIKNSNSSSNRPTLTSVPMASSSSSSSAAALAASSYDDVIYEEGSRNDNDVDVVVMSDVGAHYHSMDINAQARRSEEILNWETHGGNHFDNTGMRASESGEFGSRGSYYDQHQRRRDRNSRDFDDVSECSEYQFSDVASSVPINSSTTHRSSILKPTQPVIKSRPRIGKKIPQPPRGGLISSTTSGGGGRGASPSALGRQPPPHSQRTSTQSPQGNHTNAPPQRAESPGTLAANLSIKAKELESELELYRSENAALRKSRIHQENTLADMKQQQNEVAKWSSEERRKTEEYCEEQRQAAARERRTVAKQAREQREREQINNRKDRQEIENLQNTVDKLKADLDKSQKKGRATERRLNQCLKDANEEREQLEKTVLNLEQEKVDIWNIVETFTQEGINVVNPLRKKLAQLRAKRNAQKQQANMNAEDVKKARKALQAKSEQASQRTSRSASRAPGSSYIEEVVMDDSSAYGYHGAIAINTEASSNEVIESNVTTDFINPSVTVTVTAHDHHDPSQHLKQQQQQQKEFEVNPDFLPKSVAFEPPAASITPVISTVYQPSMNRPSHERLGLEAIEGGGADIGRALPLNFADSSTGDQEEGNGHHSVFSSTAFSSQRSSRGSRYSDSQDDSNYDIRAAVASSSHVDGHFHDNITDATVGFSQRQRQQQQQQMQGMVGKQAPKNSFAVPRQEAWPSDATNSVTANAPSTHVVESQTTNTNINTNINANTARSIETTPEGGKIVKYRNGTVKEIKSDGMVEVRFVNGDVKRTLPDKNVVVYFYREAKTKHTTFDDGREVYEFPNGQVEKHYPDGRKEIEFPDGTRKLIHLNGMQESLFSNGVIVREYENDATGYREIVTPDGQVHQDYDNDN